MVVCQCVGDVVKMEWSVDRNMLDLAWKKLDEMMKKGVEHNGNKDME